ncbi:hypothetical protein M5K25_024680 [Dendrobium thyrsiflorum]|uniref:Uncharacterized protein n=1 Tax=Dendrobium thyrsiflorum TaxID=117978 RepID=A0ABD0U2M9_DENTH
MDNGLVYFTNGKRLLYDNLLHLLEDMYMVNNEDPSELPFMIITVIISDLENSNPIIQTHNSTQTQKSSSNSKAPPRLRVLADNLGYEGAVLSKRICASLGWLAGSPIQAGIQGIEELLSMIASGRPRILLAQSSISELKVPFKDILSLLLGGSGGVFISIRSRFFAYLRRKQKELGSLLASGGSKRSQGSLAYLVF